MINNMNKHKAGKGIGETLDGILECTARKSFSRW